MSTTWNRSPPTGSSLTTDQDWPRRLGGHMFWALVPACCGYYHSPRSRTSAPAQSGLYAAMDASPVVPRTSQSACRRVRNRYSIRSVSRAPPGTKTVSRPDRCPRAQRARCCVGARSLFREALTCQLAGPRMSARGPSFQSLSPRCGSERFIRRLRTGRPPASAPTVKMRLWMHSFIRPLLTASLVLASRTDHRDREHGLVWNSKTFVYSQPRQPLQEDAILDDHRTLCALAHQDVHP